MSGVWAAEEGCEDDLVVRRTLGSITKRLALHKAGPCSTATFNLTASTCGWNFTQNPPRIEQGDKMDGGAIFTQAAVLFQSGPLDSPSSGAITLQGMGAISARFRNFEQHQWLRFSFDHGVQGSYRGVTGLKLWPLTAITCHHSITCATAPPRPSGAAQWDSCWSDGASDFGGSEAAQENNQQGEPAQQQGDLSTPRTKNKASKRKPATHVDEDPDDPISASTPADRRPPVAHGQNAVITTVSGEVG